MTDADAAGNRLARETSPYLLQHAHNPVDWYPWGAEALERARTEDKPILLSIGYSACHWCHVMAHESFENAAIARLMNEHFVNIKVDREERPDLDKIYQTAHQLIAQRPGGWPLTMFLTPQEHLPFFGGTYFPNERRHGMLSFPEILRRVALYYRDNAAEAHRQGRALADVLRELDPPAPDDRLSLDAGPLESVRRELERQFDATHGGFGSAPKFPNAPSLERLLRHWRASSGNSEPDVQALFMAAFSLRRMADGGIQDHIGGGFCRYSVDAAWQIPHFEKMLYDNGLLLALYAELWLASGDEAMREVATSTADWMLRELRSPEDGFYSSYDADSDGEEGAFYIWQRDEIRSLLDENDFAIVAARFGLDRDPNFESAWHLSVHRSVDEIAASREIDTETVTAALARARLVLFERRRQRTAPGRDEKILTSWNALAIRGLAVAARALARQDYADAAAAALDFVRTKLFVDGRLLATYKDGRSRFPAYLDDYAYCLDASLEVLQNGWNREFVEFSIRLADVLLEHFEDENSGGFFFTADDHEKLLHRARPFADDAIPAGNGVAVRALTRLGFLIGDERYLDAAERTLRAAWRAMSEYPHGHVSLITALDEYLDGPEIVVLRGPQVEIANWARSAATLYAPRRLIVAIPADSDDLPGALALRGDHGAETVAYICRGRSCSLPLTSWEALARELG